MWIRLGSFDVVQQIATMRPYTDIWLISIIAKSAIFYSFKTHKGIWRYSSTKDLIRIIKACSLAVGITVFASFLWNRGELIPRSVFIIDWFLSVFFLGGGRFTWRLLTERKNNKSKDKIRTIVIGAGSAGEQLVREIGKDKNSNLKISCILDDAYENDKRTIHGVPIIYNTSRLAEIAIKYNSTNVFIAIPSATYREVRKIVDICLREKLDVKILPAVGDILNGKVQVSHLRPVMLDDLLCRKPIELDIDALGCMLTEKSIFISGAGGSIGSELCKQVLKYKPKCIILFERCEYFLYKIEMELEKQFLGANIVSILGDVQDHERVEQVINEYTPDIIFHAAAYKHVPMIEKNPVEAISNNVIGTKVLAQAAVAGRVDKFIMISTDKAVNPTNIMGASKRVAEMVCQNLQKLGKTKFITLRFGNVLGSAGSVIPKFVEQIKRGEDITVTHPDVTRYFMSIPEATQLVLQAGTIGSGGEIFILDMGMPVKIVDLANELIRLSGLIPGEDIKIKFTGLRPGEKLYEELLADEENTLPTQHKMVRVARARGIEPNFEHFLAELIKLTETGNEDDCFELFQKIVPEYKPFKPETVLVRAV